MLPSLGWWRCENPCAARSNPATDTVKVDSSLISTADQQDANSAGRIRIEDVLAPQAGMPAGKGVTQLTDISLEYPYEDLCDATDGFSMERRLGAGAAGAVYRGCLRSGTDVAVKVLVDRGGLEGFEDEIRVLSRFRHPNLVTLFGWGHHQNEKYLIYELLEGGDVNDALSNCRDRDVPFTWSARLRVASDAASGLLHMVSSQPIVFHRDIKPANIMLTKDGSAKMADFGLAGVVLEQGAKHLITTNISGTPGYTCPEYMQTGRVSESSEVYAFGTLLLELLVNQPPALMGPKGDLIYPLLQIVQPAKPGSYDRLVAALDPKARWPLSVAEQMGDVALACVDMAPTRRPSYANITHSLRRICGSGAAGGS